MFNNPLDDIIKRHNILPIMHGIIEFDTTTKTVSIRGIANWFILLLLPTTFFVIDLLPYSLEVFGNRTAEFFTGSMFIVLCFTYWVQYRKFNKILIKLKEITNGM